MVQTEGLQVLQQRYHNGIKLGFTGTREGMTIAQWVKVGNIIQLLLPKEDGQNEWHDGDCVGADTQANNIVNEINLVRTTRMFPLVVTFGHPCDKVNFRAHNFYHVQREVKPPMTRNRDIVDSVDVMIAGPKEYEDVPRGSGTWGTIRYTKRQNKPLIIVWPDGSEEWNLGNTTLLDQ